MATNDKTEKTNSSQDTYYWCIGLLVVFGAIIIWQAFIKLDAKYPDAIAIIAHSFIASFFGGAVYYLTKNTKKLKARYLLLLKFHNPSLGIYLGQVIPDQVDFHIEDEVRTGHVQIVGATGRGKTESVIIPWLVRDLYRGKSAILIDGKGDPGLVRRLEIIFKQFETPPKLKVFDLSNLKNSITTNPLQFGSAQQITDRLFTAFEFKDPYYKSVQYREAGLLISLLKATADGVVTFKRLHEVLTDINKLSALIVGLKDIELQIKCQKLLRLTEKEREANLLGLISQIEPFATGEVASLVNGKVDGHECISLSSIVLGDLEPTALIYLISTLKYQELGKQLGKLLMQELAWAIGERAATTGEDSKFLPVYLDEFSAFVYSGFQNILNKARSSKVALHLSHQSTGDLSIVDPELATIINTNTNVKCLLGLNDPETADFFARHLGTAAVQRYTERAVDGGLLVGKKGTGDYSMRDTQEYVIHPNKLKNYTRGRGVIHLPSEDGNITCEVQFGRIA